jgi:hypothetical protein
LTKLLMQVYRSKNFVKENFDQVFDGRLWSCKRAFIQTNIYFLQKKYKYLTILSLLFNTCITLQGHIPTGV